MSCCHNKANSLGPRWGNKGLARPWAALSAPSQLCRRDKQKRSCCGGCPSAKLGGDGLEAGLLCSGAALTHSHWNRSGKLLVP